MKRHFLEPKKNTHKAIISTPSRIIGEYSNQATLITPAVPLGKATVGYDMRNSRSVYVVTHQREEFSAGTPACGRTLFNVQTTTERIKSRMSHL